MLEMLLSTLGKLIKNQYELIVLLLQFTNIA